MLTIIYAAGHILTAAGQHTTAKYRQKQKFIISHITAHLHILMAG